MTENEVIEWQKAFKKTYKGVPKDVDTACDIAIKALEEIQQYRTIGTVEEFREAREMQMGKEPNKADVQPYFRKHYANTYSCPLCNRKIVAYKQKFCQDCG